MHYRRVGKWGLKLPEIGCGEIEEVAPLARAVGASSALPPTIGSAARLQLRSEDASALGPARFERVRKGELDVVG